MGFLVVREFGQFVQVPPEVVEAVKAIKSGVYTGNPFDASIAKGDILNWAIAALTKEQGQ